MKRLLVVLAVTCLPACLDDFDVEGMTFPCRSEMDCAEDYECDTSRWVCVEAGTAGIDAGFPDSGTNTGTVADAGI